MSNQKIIFILIETLESQEVWLKSAMNMINCFYYLIKNPNQRELKSDL